MIVKSKITGKSYDTNKVVRIINPQQVAAYLIHSAEPLDIYASRHYESNVPIVIYLFDREQTKSLYDAWCKHELK